MAVVMGHLFEYVSPPHGRSGKLVCLDSVCSTNLEVGSRCLRSKMPEYLGSDFLSLQQTAGPVGI